MKKFFCALVILFAGMSLSACREDLGGSEEVEEEECIIPETEYGSLDVYLDFREDTSHWIGTDESVEVDEAYEEDCFEGLPRLNQYWINLDFPGVSCGWNHYMNPIGNDDYSGGNLQVDFLIEGGEVTDGYMSWTYISGYGVACTRTWDISIP